MEVQPGDWDEDNSLVLGSALLFGFLGLVMVATRKVDWYKSAEKLARKPIVEAPPVAG